MYKKSIILISVSALIGFSISQIKPLFLTNKDINQRLINIELKMDLLQENFSKEKKNVLNVIKEQSDRVEESAEGAKMKSEEALEIAKETEKLANDVYDRSMRLYLKSKEIKKNDEKDMTNEEN